MPHKLKRLIDSHLSAIIEVSRLHDAGLLLGAPEVQAVDAEIKKAAAAIVRHVPASLDDVRLLAKYVIDEGLIEPFIEDKKAMETFFYSLAAMPQPDEAQEAA